MTQTLLHRDFQPVPGTLCAYLLGTLSFEDFHSLQRRLIYEVGGNRDSAALILCDHPAGISVGRNGSRSHIRPNFELLEELLRPGEQKEPEPKNSPVEWVSRGGGVMLHLPGQVACYPIIPLQRVGLSAAGYVAELLNIAYSLVSQYDVQPTIDWERPGIRVSGRRIVHLGVAFRNGISSYGLIVNVNPKLELFHQVHCEGDSLPMTSLQRESSLRARLTGVRQQLLDLIAQRFGFQRHSIFHHHPSTISRSLPYVVAHRP